MPSQFVPFSPPKNSPPQKNVAKTNLRQNHNTSNKYTIFFFWDTEKIAPTKNKSLIKHILLKYSRTSAPDILHLLFSCNKNIEADAVVVYKIIMREHRGERWLEGKGKR